MDLSESPNLKRKPEPLEEEHLGSVKHNSEHNSEKFYTPESSSKEPTKIELEITKFSESTSEVPTDADKKEVPADIAEVKSAKVSKDSEETEVLEEEKSPKLSPTQSLPSENSKSVLKSPHLVLSDISNNTLPVPEVLKETPSKSLTQEDPKTPSISNSQPSPKVLPSDPLTEVSN